jgi:hypothetical protein
MDRWKLPQLKAHQQFLLGKVDGLKWVLTQQIDEPLRTSTWSCIKQVEGSVEDVATRIRVIQEEREAKKKKANRNNRRNELA